MIRSLFSGICLLGLAAPAMAIAQEPAKPTAQCDDGTGRCVVSAQFQSDTGPFGTIGVQINKDGSQPIAYALTPLGIAVRPGVRVVTDGSGELTLGVDACFPDGCRATLELTPDQLSQLTGASKIALQFFPLESDKAVSGEMEGIGLGDALRQAGVTLP